MLSGPFFKGFSEKIDEAVSHDLITLEQAQKMKANPQAFELFKAIPLYHSLYTKEELLAHTLAQARFAYYIGVAPTKAKEGVNSAKFYRGTDGTPLGVFKVQNDALSFWQRCARMCGIAQEILMAPSQYWQLYTEKAAYLLAKDLNHALLDAPAAALTSFTDAKGQKTPMGSFVQFYKGYDLAEKKISKLDKAAYTEEELEKFQIFAIYDFILGNLDRHAQNWLVKIDENDRVAQIIPIDHANAFPEAAPRFYNVAGWWKKFQWKKLKIANQAFTPSIRHYVKGLEADFIEHLFSRLNSDAEIKALRGQEGIKTAYFNEKIKTEMKKRFEALKAGMDQPSWTPIHLAACW